MSAKKIDTSLPAAAAGKSVFLTGATGYIGGQVFQKLLSLSSPPSKITFLLRDEKKASLVTSLETPPSVEINPLVGSLSDLAKLEAAAAAHDIVLSTADADDLLAVQALIKGMKARKQKTGHRSLFIHTSGTGVFADNAKGQYPSDTIYTDLNPTPATAKTPALLSVEKLPNDAIHRNVDMEIVNADGEGILKSYIILPSTIWGEGKGDLYSAGFSNSFSQQMPNLIKNSLDRGRAGHVGKGANIWPHVNINDLGDLYSLVYAGALRGDIGHGKSGYYFGISGEYTLLSAASTIGATLVKNGWAEEAQPTTFTEEEIKKYYNGNYYAGSNSRGVADRSKSIGWKPKMNETEDFVEGLRTEAVRVEKTFGRTRGEVKGTSYTS